MTRGARVEAGGLRMTSFEIRCDEDLLRILSSTHFSTAKLKFRNFPRYELQFFGPIDEDAYHDAVAKLRQYANTQFRRLKYGPTSRRRLTERERALIKVKASRPGGRRIVLDLSGFANACVAVVDELGDSENFSTVLLSDATALTFQSSPNEHAAARDAAIGLFGMVPVSQRRGALLGAVCLIVLGIVAKAGIASLCECVAKLDKQHLDQVVALAKIDKDFQLGQMKLNLAANFATSLGGKPVTLAAADQKKLDDDLSASARAITQALASQPDGGAFVIRAIADFDDARPALLALATSDGIVVNGAHYSAQGARFASQAHAKDARDVRKALKDAAREWKTTVRRAVES